MSYTVPSDEAIKELLTQTKTIAIVGLSQDESKPSHRVAKYLQEQGYKVIPVNPNVDQLLGEKSYPSLTAIPDRIDIVNVFRPSTSIPPIAEQAAEVEPACLWLQLGITHSSAEEVAYRDPGILLVMDRCIMVEHQRLLGQGAAE